MKSAKKLFPRVLSLVMECFGVKTRELADKIYYSEDSVYSWKTRSSPRNGEAFGKLKDGLINLLEAKKFELYMRRDEFVKAAGEVFSSYGLACEWNLIRTDKLEYINMVEKAMILAFSHKNLEIAQKEETESEEKKPTKIKKLVVFDLDGTLIKGIKYSWTLLYQAANVSTDKCRINKKRFVNGEISYPEWVDYDLAELRAGGLTKEIAQRAATVNCALTKNFYPAIEKLKNAGCAFGIISGGVDIVLYTLIPDADEIFDHNIYINKLKFDEKTGELVDIEATPYDWDDDGKVRGVSGKNVGLKLLCKKYGIKVKDAVFVGDDDNDLKAMRIAGTKILYHSCDPSDATTGKGSRKIPEGTQVIYKNDLLEVADSILESM